MVERKNKEEDNLYRIKEILFGDDLQTVNQRFSELKDEWEHNLTSFKETTTEHLDKIKNHHDEHVQDFEQMRKQFLEKIEALRLEMNEQMHILQQQIKNHEDKVSDELLAINERQVSKSELSELLKGIIEKLQ